MFKASGTISKDRLESLLVTELSDMSYNNQNLQLEDELLNIVKKLSYTDLENILLKLGVLYKENEE